LLQPETNFLTQNAQEAFGDLHGELTARPQTL